MDLIKPGAQAGTRAARPGGRQPGLAGHRGAPSDDLTGVRGS